MGDVAFWTVKDMVVRYQVSDRQIRDMALAGEIPALRMGLKLWRFPVDRVLAWERSKVRAVSA